MTTSTSRISRLTAGSSAMAAHSITRGRAGRTTMEAQMSLQRRRLIGLCCALAMIVGGGAFAWWRIDRIGQEGWAGLAYMPDMKNANGKAPPAIAGYRPGMVFMVFPGGPADRAGIARMSRIVSIDGVPISDMKRITAMADRIHRGDSAVYRTEQDGVLRDHRLRFDSPVGTPFFIAAGTIT